MSVRPGSGMRRLLSNPILVSVEFSGPNDPRWFGGNSKVWNRAGELKIEQTGDCIVSGECSEIIVKKCNLKLYIQGWCHVVPLVPTKENGYIRVSFQALRYSIDSMTYNREQNVVANKQRSMILSRLNDIQASQQIVPDFAEWQATLES